MSYPTRLLAGEQRAAIRAIEGFARTLQEISRGSLADTQKYALLEQQATDLAQMGNQGAKAALPALARACEHFELPLQSLQELLADARLEVARGACESFDELLGHCRRTGGSLGRLGVAVLGSSDPARAGELAESVGTAVKLAQLLCSLRVDAEAGRVYLPVEDFRRYRLLDEGQLSMGAGALAVLARAGSDAAPAALAGMDGGEQAQLYALMRFQVLRTHDWLHRGAALQQLLDRRAVTCLLTVTGRCSRLLDRIAARPDLALAGGMSLPVRERVGVSVRGLLGRGPRERHPAERL